MRKSAMTKHAVFAAICVSLLHQTVRADSRVEEAAAAKTQSYKRLQNVTCTIIGQLEVSTKTLESMPAQVRSSAGAAHIAATSEKFTEYLEECKQIRTALQSPGNTGSGTDPDDCVGARQEGYDQAEELASAGAPHGPCAAIAKQLLSELEAIKARPETLEETLADPNRTSSKLQEVACYVEEMIRLTIADQKNQRAIEKASGVADLSARRSIGEDLVRLQQQKRACAGALKARGARAGKCSVPEESGIRDLEYGDTCAEIAAAMAR
jgi:hypothetical protein